MKQLSALDISFLVGELQNLVNSRVDQVYQPARKQYEFQVHRRGTGKAVLKVSLPHIAFLTTERDTARAVTGLCSLLRKKLNNTTITAVSQPNFERIIKIDFSSSNGKFSIYLELFSKGNIILVDDKTIVAVEEPQTWASRRLAPKEVYKLPPAAQDPSSLDEETLKQMLKDSVKIDIVRFLAMELSLGGLYAEELCMRANIHKATKLSSVDPGKLLKEVKLLLTEKISPVIVLDNHVPLDATPIKMKTYHNKNQQPTDTFSEALQVVYKLSAEKKSPYDVKIAQIQAIIDQQNQSILETQDAAERNSAVGEAIYNNYQDIKNILLEVQEAQKQGDWAKISKIKGIKAVSKKNGTITLEI